MFKADISLSEIESLESAISECGASETQLVGINDFGIAVGFDVVNRAMHGIIFDSHEAQRTALPRGYLPLANYVAANCRKVDNSCRWLVRTSNHQNSVTTS